VKDAPAWPEGHALRHFPEIDSTNEEARRLAAAGERGPLWLTADRQTKGRGRRGREWQSPPGNLAATLLLNPDRPIAQCAQLSFVAAIALAEMAARYVPGSDVQVKWPNDVLAGDRKLAGILLESAGNEGARPDWLAIGFGINLAWHPENTEFPAVSLAALGASPPPAIEALGWLAASWTKWYEMWSERGFEPIRDAWLARAARLGSRIRARLAGTEANGVFEGIDESGALILRETPLRVRMIAAGEVYFQ
jgi:BirA family biotin operon repressor/biotin-[acetyl-CoA-carboxylase] ligase